MSAAAVYAFATAYKIETNSTKSLCGLAAMLLESGRVQESLTYLAAAEVNIDVENIPMINHNKGVGKKKKKIKYFFYVDIFLTNLALTIK